MVSAAKVLQDLRASAERKPDIVVRLGKPLVETGAVLKLDADGTTLLIISFDDQEGQHNSGVEQD
jgi:hypothetical protein